MSQDQKSQAPITVTGRHRGQQHGPICRLISPGDLGEALKPFIFLDHFNAEIEPGFGFAMHPHSGIATLTWQPGSDVRYRDTTGKNGVLEAGGLEWMNAGGGAWHQGELLGEGHVIGFQLWLPMPPDVENGPAFGQYVPPEEVPSISIDGGTVRVLLGSIAHGQQVATSPIEPHQDINYFAVELDGGSFWSYPVPASHDIIWVVSYKGKGRVAGEQAEGTMLTFAGSGVLEFAAADTGAAFIAGSARRHPHPLVLGQSSVHSSLESLARGERCIQRLHSELISAGLI